MNFQHPTFHDISLINAVVQANEEEEHECLSDPEAWSIKFARRHPRIFSLFSSSILLGLIVLILIAVWEYLF